VRTNTLVTFWPSISMWMPPPRYLLRYARQKLLHFPEDAGEVAGFSCTAEAFDGVLPCMGSELHSTCLPSRSMACTSFGICPPSTVGTHTHDQISRPGSFSGVHTSISRSKLVRVGAGAVLNADGVVDAAQMNSTMGTCRAGGYGRRSRACARTVVPVARWAVPGG